MYVLSLTEVVENGKLHCALIQEQLTEEQANFFGFKTRIDLKDGITLLKYFKNFPEKAKVKNYEIIFSHFLQLSSIDKEKLKKERDNVCLLAEDNSLVIASKLKYVDSEQFSTTTEKAKFLKNILNLSHQQMLEICRLFEIEIISAQEKQIIFIAEVEDNSLKDFIYKRLPLIALHEAHLHKEEPMQVLNSLLDRLTRMKCYEVKELKVKISIQTEYNEEDCFLNNNILYYVGRWNKSSAKNEILECVLRYLNVIKNAKIWKVFKLKEDQEFSAWVRKEHPQSIELYSGLKAALKDRPQVQDVSLSLESTGSSFISTSITEPSQQDNILNDSFENSEKKITEEDVINGLDVSMGALDINEKDSKPQTPPVSPIKPNNKEEKEEGDPNLGSTPSTKQKTPSVPGKKINNALRKPESSATNQSLDDSKTNLENSFQNVNFKKTGLFAKKNAFVLKPKTQTAPKTSLDFPSTNPPKVKNTGAKEEKKQEVGRWSEKFVYLFFKDRYETKFSTQVTSTSHGFKIEGTRKKSKQKTTVEVTWFNMKGETMFAADLKIIKLKSGVEKPKEKIIEVKGTVSENKRSFQISKNEVEFMKHYKDQYFIFRVFNALNEEEARIEQISNPQAEIDAKKISLEPEVYKMEYSPT